MKIGQRLVLNTTEDTHAHVFKDRSWQLTANFVSPNFDFRMLRYDNVSRFGDPLISFGEMQVVDIDTRVHNDSLKVNLIWTVHQAVSNNFTVSILLLDADGTLKAQDDDYPMNGTSPTSTWASDQFYFDGHVLDITDLPPGSYRVGIQVYHFVSEDFSEIEHIQPNTCQPNCQFDFIAEVEIK